MALFDIQKGASAVGRDSAGERFPRATLRLKGCERCGGDVSSGYDWHGGYLQCLQCGWYKDEPGDALSGMVAASMSTLMEDMERYNRSQRRAS